MQRGGPTIGGAADYVDVGRDGRRGPVEPRPGLARASGPSSAPARLAPRSSERPGPGLEPRPSGDVAAAVFHTQNRRFGCD